MTFALLPLLSCVFALLLTISSNAQTLLRIFPKLDYPTEAIPTGEFATVDVDGDGDLDVIAANGREGEDALLLNDGFGNLTRAPLSQWPSKKGWPYWSVAVGDVNGDGAPDVVLADKTYSLVTLRFGDGKGNFRDAGQASLPPFPVAEAGELLLSDIDRDGDLDLLILIRGYAKPAILTWQNDGKGNLTQVVMHLPELYSGFTVGYAVDVTGDGAPDIICAGASTGPFVIVNDGGGRLSDETRSRMPSGAMTAAAVSVGDVDGDGDIDIVGGGRGRAGTRIWMNDGKGHFTEETATRMPGDVGLYDTLRTYLVDLDRDGDLDLFLQNHSSVPYGSNCRVYVNDGQGRYSDDSARWFPLFTSEPMYSGAFADLDSDGDPDLLFARGDLSPVAASQNRVYMNTLRQIYAPAAAVRGNPYPLEIYGEPNEIVLLVMGLAAQRQPAPPLGVLQLDLSQSIVLPGATQLPATGRATVPLVIPALPSLLGKDVYTQALFLDLQKPERSGLSNGVRDTIQ